MVPPLAMPTVTSCACSKPAQRHKPQTLPTSTHRLLKSASAFRDCWFQRFGGCEWTLTMEGVPADMGDWGIKGVFLEAGRLLCKHLPDFLPIILVLIFPAALIKVLHTQFFVADFGGPKGSSYFPEPTSFWLVLLLGLLWAVPQLLIIIAFFTIPHVLKHSIYTTGLKADRHSQSLYTSIKSAFSPSPEVGQTGGSFLVRLWGASKGKRLKGFPAVVLCVMLYAAVSTSGMNFTPEAVTAMGLPLWTIFLITLLIATVTTVVTSYSLLVGIVMVLWMWSSETQILM